MMYDRWRTSDLDPKVIMGQAGERPGPDDPVLGSMRSVELARMTVEAHNRLTDDREDPVSDEIRERAARVVERVCDILQGSSDPVTESAAADLRATMLQLIEMASRRGYDATPGSS